MFNFSSFFKTSNLAEDLKSLVQSKVEAALIEKFYSDRGIKYSDPLHALLDKPKTKSADPYFQQFYSQDIELILSQIKKLKEITIQEFSDKINDLYNSISYIGITKDVFSAIIFDATSSRVSPERVLKNFPTVVDSLSTKNNIDKLSTAKILSDLQLKIYALKNSIINNAENISIINRIIQSKSLPKDISDDLKSKILKEFSEINFLSLLKDIGFDNSNYVESNNIPSPDDPNNTIPIYTKIIDFLRNNDEIININENTIKKIFNVLMEPKTIKTNPIRSFYTQNFKAQHEDEYDTESFLNYIGDALEYGKINGLVNKNDDIQQFIYAINEKYNAYLLGTKSEYLDSEYTNVFKFSSKEESEVIKKVIRDEFQLACIACQMSLPTPYGEPDYKSYFKIDFMINCDVVNFEHQNGITVPNIIENTIFVGEYFGLYKPDDKRLKGMSYENYNKKTHVKQVTEEVFCTLLDGGYFAIFPKEVKGDWALQVQNGLDNNKAIYNTKNSNIVKNNPNCALNKLIEWYKNAPDNLKQQYKQKLSKYINTDNFEPKNGIEFKHSKYSTWFTMMRKSLHGSYLSQEINLNKKSFNFDKLKEFRDSLKSSENKTEQIKSSDFNKTSNYLANLKKQAYEKEELQEKLQFLNSLESFVKQHEHEINDTMLKRFFQTILNKKENFKNIKGILNFEEILKKKIEAFNLHFFTKRYNDIQENKTKMNNFDLIQKLIRLSTIAEAIEETSPMAANEIDSFVQDAADTLPGELNDVSTDLFPPVRTPQEPTNKESEMHQTLSSIVDEILEDDEFKAIIPTLNTQKGNLILDNIINNKLENF